MINNNRNLLLSAFINGSDSSVYWW